MVKKRAIKGPEKSPYSSNTASLMKSMGNSLREGLLKTQKSLKLPKASGSLPGSSNIPPLPRKFNSVQKGKEFTIGSFMKHKELLTQTSPQKKDTRSYPHSLAEPSLQNADLKNCESYHSQKVSMFEGTEVSANATQANGPFFRTELTSKNDYQSSLQLEFAVNETTRKLTTVTTPP